MVFSSLVFICIFLPIVFLLYICIDNMHIRNALLIAASLLFYAYGEPIYILLMLFSTIFNYFMALHVEDNKPMLILDVLVNVGLLVVFKYTDMIIQTVIGMGFTIPLTYISLPIGISFFTFQSMSYVIDVYRKKVKPQRKYSNVLLYVSFFPQLIAGPIVKYRDIEQQIENREVNEVEISQGFQRFIIGLSKKVLISNTMASTVDTIFSLSSMNIFTAWIGAFAYLFQIYFDFSGYSDMAIGMGHIFGFTFLENFNYPYISTSIKEFWRRWHISLSSWFKEYVYIPLGGNRKGAFRTSINKIIVFFITGLWHGANWTFVCWGLYHGLFSLMEQVIPIKKLPKVLGHIYTILIVTIGFVIFRADNMMQAIQYIHSMFTGFDFTTLTTTLNQCTPIFILTFILACIGCTPVFKKLKMESFVGYAYTMILFVLCLLSLSSGTYNPFIYFRF